MKETNREKTKKRESNKRRLERIKKKVFLDYGAQKTRPLTNISDILF